MVALEDGVGRAVILYNITNKFATCVMCNRVSDITSSCTMSVFVARLVVMLAEWRESVFKPML